MNPIQSELLNDKIYRALCMSISNRADYVEWDKFNVGDWDRLYDTANKERVAAVLYWSLFNSKSVSEHKIPLSLLTKLRSLYYSIWVHNTGLYQQLRPILESMNKAGLHVVLLKGVSLAANLYPDIGLRPMGDLDLLVCDSQLNTAVQIASSFGYKDNVPDAGRGTKEMLAYNVCLFNPDHAKTALEIHTSLVGREAISFTVSMDWFWEQTEQFSRKLQGIGAENQEILIEQVYKLTPSAQIIYLSAHAVLQHGLGDMSLIWLYDIHRLIIQNNSEIDWNLIKSKVQSFNWEAVIYTALSLVKSFFETPVTEEILSKFEKFSDEKIYKLIQDRTDFPKTRMISEWRKLKTMNWQDRFRLAAALLFPTKEYMMWRYRPKDSWSLPYYYIYRWVDILKDGIRTIFLIIRKGT